MVMVMEKARKNGGSSKKNLTINEKTLKYYFKVFSFIMTNQNPIWGSYSMIKS